MFNSLKHLFSSEKTEVNVVKKFEIPLIGYSPYPDRTHCHKAPSLEDFFIQYSDKLLVKPDGYNPFHTEEGQKDARVQYEDFCGRGREKFNRLLDGKKNWFYDEKENFARTILKKQPIGHYCVRKHPMGRDKGFASIYFIGNDYKIKKVPIERWTDSKLYYFKIQESEYHFENFTQIMDFLVKTQLPLHDTILTTGCPKKRM